MPDPSGLPPPYLDPSQYPEYLDAQKKQMLAQMLMGNMQQAGQTPSDWDSMRVVPKRSPLQGVTQLASALLAGRAMKGAQKAQTQYFQSLYGEPASSSQSAAAAPISLQPPPSDANEQSVQPLVARNGQSFDQAMGGGQPAPAPSNPMIPPGMSRGTASALMGMMGPEKYGESFVAPAFKPAEIRAQIRAAGVDPDSEQGRRMALGALQKALTNVTDVRQGGTLFDNSTGKPLFTAPNASGVQIGWGPNGPVADAVPGYQEAEARGKGLETAASVQNTPREVPIGGGAERLMYPGDVPSLGAPPVLREKGPVSKSYFSASGGASQPKTAQPEWIKNAPKMEIPNTPGSTTDAYHQKILDKAAEKHVELSDKYGSEADLADARLAFNNEALKLLRDGRPEMGPLSDKLVKLKAKAEELGLPADWLPGKGDAGDTQVVKKLFLRNPLLNLKPTFGGRPAAAEFQVLRSEASPSEEQLGRAAQKLLEMDNVQAEYARQRARDYGAYHSAGGDPFRFESYYSNSHPFSKSLSDSLKTPSVSGKSQNEARTEAPPAALEHLKQHPELKEAFRQKYGYAP